MLLVDQFQILKDRARILDGRWALPAEARSGGSARVYRAKDLTDAIETAVAVKVVSATLNGDQKVAALLFEREQRTLMKLRHEGIVELIDGGRDRDTGERYFVFDWLEHDLRSVLADTGGMTWQTWWQRYGRPILRALAYAHDEDVAHRDIKPANVMLGPEGEPRLADFGIAKLTDDVSLGATLRAHQTPPYAPRDYEDERYNFQRDVYGFAAMSVLAVAGADPHVADADPYEILDEALSTLECNRQVREILESALSGEPRDRPPDAGALLARLERAEPSSDPQRPPVPFVLRGKAAACIADAFELRNKQDAPATAAEELAAGMAMQPMDGSFEDGTPRDGHFTIYGGELKLHAQLAADRSHLLVHNAWRLPWSLVEREMERGHRVEGPARFMLDRLLGSGQPELLAKIERSAHETLADLRAAELAERRLGALPVWRRTLAAGRAVLKGLELPWAYTSAHLLDGSEIELRLGDDPSDALMEARRLAIVNEEEIPLVMAVASRDGRAFRGSLALGRPEQVPAHGRLHIDTRPSRVALRRQEQALDAVQYGRAHRPAMLDLLVLPESARTPRAVQGVSFVREDLDETKRAAVCAALGSEDMLVVEGPPGTGKTTFITELILAELAARPTMRILLGSQTHAALDNVLERIADHDIRMLRIARPGETRVAEGAKDLLMGAQIEEWRREGIRAGRAWLRNWAAARNLDVSTIETAVRFEELAAVRAERARLARERTEAEQRLVEARTTRQANPDSTSVESLFVLTEAVDDLRERLGALGDDAERLAARLVELGQADDARALTQLPVEELRARAEVEVADADGDMQTGKQLLSLLGEWHARIGRSREFEAAALMRAQLVAATCVGYAAVPGAETASYDLCIIDEASKATSTELLVPMARAQRWVLVGDHRQLPPFIDEALRDAALLKDHTLTVEDLKRTLFDDLRTGLPRDCVKELTEQYRMLPAIGRLISEVFYDNKLVSHEREPPAWLRPPVAARPVVWHTTARSGKRGEVDRDGSLSNPYEARYIRKLLGRLDFLASAAGFAHGDGRELEVAVLSGYSAQVSELERLLADDESTWRAIAVTVSTIDAFQGRESDVTIYSVTRSNPLGRIGFLAERRRLNVALSRGKDLLVIVGDHLATTKGNENPLAEVLEHIEDHPEDCALEEAAL